MGEKELFKQIRQNMETKTTEELLAILQEHDGEAWTETAFDAVRQVLNDRGEILPRQEPPVEKIGEEPRSGTARIIWNTEIQTCQKCKAKAAGKAYPVYIGIRKDDNAYLHRVAGSEAVFICDQCVVRPMHAATIALITAFLGAMAAVFGFLGLANMMVFFQEKQFAVLLISLILLGLASLFVYWISTLWKKTKEDAPNLYWGSRAAKKTRADDLRSQGFLAWTSSQYLKLLDNSEMKYEPDPQFSPLETDLIPRESTPAPAQTPLMNSTARPSANQKSYLLLYYSSIPPSAAEQSELVRGFAAQSGTPVKILEVLHTPKIPSGPDEFVITTCLFACDKHQVPYNNDRDDIAYRIGPGLGMAIVTIRK